MEEKKWLVITYFTKIDGMACSQHVDDRIDYLKAKGIIPTILSGICGGKWHDLIHFRVPSVAPSGIKFELRHLKRKMPVLKLVKPLFDLLLLPLFLTEKLIIDLDSQWSWFPLAILSGKRVSRKQRLELIYSTGGAASAHFAAAIIAKWTGLPWIAEFQDPIVFDNWQRSKRAFSVYGWLERLICKNASAVIYLTDAALMNARQRTQLGNRGWRLYPGADPDLMQLTSYEKGDHCCFAHIGSLGGSRNLMVFLEGLRLAIEENEDLANYVRLCIYGTCDPISKEAIKVFPRSSIIFNYGRVSRKDSLVAMLKSDVLLLIQNTEAISAETIPSKAYEYLHSRRPILGLIYKNHELAKMLEDQGHCTVEADNAQSVKTQIISLVEKWHAGKLHNGSTSPYTILSAVDELIAIAEHC